MGAAHQLKQGFRVSVFEKDSRLGGHSHTVTVQEGAKEVPIDTGFMVFNYETYPRLTALFDELDIPVKKTRMSFGMHHVPDNIAFCGSRPSQLFARRSNAFRPDFWLMLRDIFRFNREALRFIDNSGDLSLTLEEFLRGMRPSKAFEEYYLLPMCSAIWSTPADQMLNYPALSLFRFMRNHALLQTGGHHQWWTVDGGAKVYRDRLLEPIRHRTYTDRGIARVVSQGNQVEVFDSLGQSHLFDYVVIATHADQALRLLIQPTVMQQHLLSKFKYSESTTLLHTDSSVMPAERNAWASWNYRFEVGADGNPHASTHYWMNSLQGLSDETDYFVSLNPPQGVASDRILKAMSYRHPAFDYGAIAAQNQLSLLNRGSRIQFAGSYFGNGFHEDGLRAGQEAAMEIQRQEANRERVAV